MRICPYKTSTNERVECVPGFSPSACAGATKTSASAFLLTVSSAKRATMSAGFTADSLHLSSLESIPQSRIDLALQRNGRRCFHQQGSRCRMWIPPETKDPVIYTMRHERASATSPPCVCGGILFRHEAVGFNGESFLGVSQVVPRSYFGGPSPSSSDQ